MSTPTTAQISTMTLGELASAFNALAAKPVKRFRDKATAIRRLNDEIEGVKQDEAIEKHVAKRTRTFNYTYPLKDEGARPVREGSKRARVIEQLRDGTTVEEVMAENGWNERQAREGIRLIHTYVGYGLVQDEETGVISLVE